MDTYKSFSGDERAVYVGPPEKQQSWPIPYQGLPECGPSESDHSKETNTALHTRRSPPHQAHSCESGKRLGIARAIPTQESGSSCRSPYGPRRLLKSLMGRPSHGLYVPLFRTYAGRMHGSMMGR